MDEASLAELDDGRIIANMRHVEEGMNLSIHLRSASGWIIRHSPGLPGTLIAAWSVTKEAFNVPRG